MTKLKRHIILWWICFYLSCYQSKIYCEYVAFLR